MKIGPDWRSFQLPGMASRVGTTALCAFVAALMTITVSVQAQTANSIEGVTSSQQGNATQLRISLKNAPAAVPPNFTISNPPRLALDFTDTANGSGKNRVDLGQGDVRSVAIVEAGSRARVVMNLKRAMTHTVVIDGRDIVVTLDPMAAATATATAQAPYVFARGDGDTTHALRDVDFRRGKEGEGRIVVQMSSSGVGVDMRQQGDTLIVDFLKTKLPDNLRRRFDVGDFATPVREVRAFQQGDNTRLVIDSHGLWEHNAYQSDTQFVVEVKPLREDSSKLSQGKGYKGERLSLNFQAIDVRALLQVIADFTNLNVVTTDSVSGSLTLRLKDVPWDQALDIILQSKGLGMRKNGNVIVVAPSEELAAKEKLDLENRLQIADIEPLRSEVFQLNYQKAEILQKLLSDPKQRVLSKRGSVVVDGRTNKLFVQDVAVSLDAVRNMITQIDIPIRQVLIEARIVEADDRFSRNLGVKLGYNDISTTVASASSYIDPVSGAPTAINVPTYNPGTRVLGAFGTISGTLSGVADLSSQRGSTLAGPNAIGLGRLTTIDNTQFVNLPAAAISGAQPASFAISLFGSRFTRFLNLEVSALEADQRGKVISSPRVLTADQHKAVIEQGTELPYQEATSSGATSISFRKANLKLEVTPQITPDGNVILAVEVNRDAVGQLTPSGFAIDTRRVQTQVLVENGGTVVIGGIYEQFERNRTNKVPLLGDIPVLGYLFKDNQRTNDRTELMVFITPRVVTETAAAR